MDTNRRRARQLRRTMTEAEQYLWRCLRGRQIEGFRFRRQVAIHGYVVDFLCPQAKLVCIDLQPVATGQTVERNDVLHVGGFSDAVFDLIANFATEGFGAKRWVEKIASIEF